MDTISIKQGESLSIGFTFNSSYDESRIVDMLLYLDGVLIGRKSSGTLNKTTCYSAYVSSDETFIMEGYRDVILVLEDAELGVRKFIIAGVEFDKLADEFHADVDNNGYNILLELTVDETTLHGTSTLIEVLRGPSGSGVLPSGGTVGQTIIKNSNIDQDYSWGDPTQVNADWNATSGYAQILNKPNVLTVQQQVDWTATTGVTSILNKPIIITPVNSDWNSTTGLSAILNKPTYFPASDVYPWAKQPEKPVYNYSEILNTPTLISSFVNDSGYLKSIDITDSLVTSKILTGLNIAGGSITSTDSILVSFGKLQNLINGLIGGSIFQSTWNANTNIPALTSGVGTKGYYYIVNVSGSTSLDGINNWEIGDWAIFDGTVWRKVDNTDAVSSVNGYTGSVSLTKTDIGLSNVPNLSFSGSNTGDETNSSIISKIGFTPYNSTNPNNYIQLTALSSTATGLTYTNTTGIFSLTSGYSIPTTTQLSNFTTAYGWGNHAGLYRPISYVPAWSEITLNPFSFASLANGQLLKYNSTTSKFENFTPNYLTSFSETDPVFSAWNKSTGISITKSQVSDFGTYEAPLTFSTGLSRIGNTVTNIITQYTDAQARSAQYTANSTTTGLLTSADWSTFNSKLPPISYNQPSNGSYQLLWGSGNNVYGNSNITCNPYTGVLSATQFSGSGAGLTGLTSGQITTALGYTPKPTFAENTGFNKNFGTTTGTVLEGRTFGTAANSAISDFQPVITGLTTNYIPRWGGSGFVNSMIGTDGSNIINLFLGDSKKVRILHASDGNYIQSNNTQETASEPLIFSGLFGTYGYFKFLGDINIPSATNSTSPTTGALVVGGGIGSGGSVFASGFKTSRNSASYLLATDGSDIDVNLIGGVSQVQQTINGSGSGVIVCSEPFRYNTYKKVIIYLQTLNGSAGYTFPVQFTYTPIVSTNNVSISYTVSETSIYISASFISGLVVLEGY